MKYAILLLSLPLALIAGCCCNCPCEAPPAGDPHVEASTTGPVGDPHPESSSESGMVSMPRPDLGTGSSST